MVSGTVSSGVGTGAADSGQYVRTAGSTGCGGTDYCGRQLCPGQMGQPPGKGIVRFHGSVAGVSLEGQEIALFPQEKSEGTEEIQQMIQSYNAMAKRINDNIIKDYIYRLNQKQAELKMLQFQINPHFLYNALNTISSIAQLQDVDYIPEIASDCPICSGTILTEGKLFLYGKKSPRQRTICVFRKSVFRSAFLWKSLWRRNCLTVRY